MELDLSRDVRCVLGLPFDALTEARAEQRLRQAIESRARCFLSTPNLNFAVACQDDAAFRQSVLESDLSVADGWPIVVIGRLTGANLPGRVAGSTLFERLVASADRPPVSVYFFGGPNGAAQAACARLNSLDAGARCVGHDSPGFGSVEQMSEPARLERLNATSPDFVVVALGAKKGQAWIRHNLRHLDAPVISHLGAVVNFVAGTVSRAPGWVQSARLEWLWRVREEPALWRRYAKDGLALARLLVSRALPLAVDQWFTRRDASSVRLANATLADDVGDGIAHVALDGGWTVDNIDSLRPVLANAFDRGGAISLDLSGVARIDCAVIGLLMILRGALGKAGRAWKVERASARCARSMRLAGADFLLSDL
jgi:N-acetylglucosaminyldiphosphoundecaprenol N-acetyl-beta-D-mannosaminyltransferase